MKLKRSERLIDMTNYLINHPRTLITSGFFVTRYSSAKSSISEDLSIMKSTLEKQQLGTIEITNGAAGGIKYLPGIGSEEAHKVVDELTEQLADPSRKLPGGYLYMSDLLGHPSTLRAIGRMLASEYMRYDVDAVMTVETKGIPLAQAVANYLNVPFIIVRHESVITEGSTISVNYVSRSSERIQKMELSKRSLQRGMKVLIVDDYMKGGGTVHAMVDLLKEFEAELTGIAVFAEGTYKGQRAIEDFTSLLNVDTSQDGQVQIKAGNYFERNFKDIEER